jgi:hypothetical protein
MTPLSVPGWLTIDREDMGITKVEAVLSKITAKRMPRGRMKESRH